MFEFTRLITLQLTRSLYKSPFTIINLITKSIGYTRLGQKHYENKKQMNS